MFANLRVAVERPFKQWLDYHHGAPPDPLRQKQFYRCEGCHGLVSWKRIQDGGCECAMSSRVREARLTFFDKARLLLLPWSV